MAGKGQASRPLVERFWEKVQKSSGCWIWYGAVSNRGYGNIKGENNGPVRLAHRVAYEFTRGPIPQDMDLDHLCHNADPNCSGGWICQHRRCVNPAHLEPVTPQTNSLRGKTIAAKRASQETCDRGHPFEIRNYDVGRRCYVCANEYQKAVNKQKRFNQMVEALLGAA